ncbi:MAG: TPR repeat protein [Gammaproteobacteria bacterium]|jgi:TPR repeat protein
MTFLARCGVALSVGIVVVRVAVGEPVPANNGPLHTRGPSHADVAIDAQVLLERTNEGDARAAWLLGTRFASGRAGVRDDSEALRWFRRAADLGLPQAQYNIGIMYANGQGVPKDWVQASRWFENAAEQGLAQAQFNIGTLHSQGKGVALEDARAVHWLGRAAPSGLAAAQFNLAVLYEHGVGVGRNA